MKVRLQITGEELRAKFPIHTSKTGQGQDYKLVRLPGVRHQLCVCVCVCTHPH